MVKNQSPTPKNAKKEMQMPFPDAMKQVMGGKKIQRLEWPKDEYGVLRESFLMIYRNDKWHTLILSEGDLLAIDWVVMK